MWFSVLGGCAVDTRKITNTQKETQIIGTCCYTCTFRMRLASTHSPSNRSQCLRARIVRLCIFNWCYALLNGFVFNYDMPCYWLTLLDNPFGLFRVCSLPFRV